MMKRLIAGLVCASLAGAANATEWNPSAELGLVYTSGNSDTFNFNAKAALHGEDETWVHDFYALGLRSEVDDDVSANRYEAGARSGYKFTDRSYWFGSLRYENDDFAPFEWQAVVSLGYGYQAIKSDVTTLLFEIGPGYRRAELVGLDETEGDGILRGFMDFKHKFTENTEFFDALLIEAGSDNTFVQNDIGIQVAMNKTLSLKAGFQVRHNTDVQPGLDKTDTLTTINLVWSPE